VITNFNNIFCLSRMFATNNDDAMRLAVGCTNSAAVSQIADQPSHDSMFVT
jgi:hypothetical protein